MIQGDGTYDYTDRFGHRIRADRLTGIGVQVFVSDLPTGVSAHYVTIPWEEWNALVEAVQSDKLTVCKHCGEAIRLGTFNPDTWTTLGERRSTDCPARGSWIDGDYQGHEGGTAWRVSSATSGTCTRSATSAAGSTGRRPRTTARSACSR